jgi:PPOX class probable F420-dependent enzyme
MVIDTSTPFGERAARRLREEEIIWLTTVRAGGQPQPIPVWFLWHDGQVMVYSQPSKQKLRNIERNPAVSLNLHSDDQGGDVVILFGQARITTDRSPAPVRAAYLEKYGAAIERIGLTPDGMEREYSTVIWVTPTRLHGH